MSRRRRSGFFDDLGRALFGPIGTQERQEQRALKAQTLILFILVLPFMWLFPAGEDGSFGHFNDFLFWVVSGILVFWIKFGAIIIIGGVAAFLALGSRTNATGRGKTASRRNPRAKTYSSPARKPLRDTRSDLRDFE